MPEINTITLKDGSKVRVWNITKRVGGNDKAFSVETELVQFLLAWTGTANTDSAIIGFDQIDGVWDEDCQAALEAFEQKTSKLTFNDGFVDPMKPGKAFGSLSQRIYKLMMLQNNYIIARFGTDPHDLSAGDFEKKLMSIPEDNKEILPKDLAFFMMASRPSGFLPP